MNKELATSTLIDAIVDSMHNRKARRVTRLDLSAIEGAAVANHIICEGTSTTQVDAIADNVRDELLEKRGTKPYNYAGYRASEWIVLDYGDTLAHIFLPDARTRYNLEELWSDAAVTVYPDID